MVFYALSTTQAINLAVGHVLRLLACFEPLMHQCIVKSYMSLVA